MIRDKIIETIDSERLQKLGKNHKVLDALDKFLTACLYVLIGLAIGIVAGVYLVKL